MIGDVVGATREISTHQVPSAPVALRLFALDEPGSGGANHHYAVTAANAGGNVYGDIHFQNGPIGEQGVNGLDHEVLLAIVMDRLQAFQRGPYASHDNADALLHLDSALGALQRRTLRRMARGVEGSSAA